MITDINENKTTNIPNFFLTQPLTACAQTKAIDAGGERKRDGERKKETGRERVKLGSVFE